MESVRRSGFRRAVSALPLALLVASTAEARGQALRPLPPPGDTVSVVPGAAYRAGPLYRAFMGDGHRDLWTTAIRVPVADLTTLGGGLTPVRVGGGMTTRTLHLDAVDGRRYVFRSVDKEPVDLIDEFVGTPLEAILRDQMSSFHPSGAVVVARLLDAVDVLHTNPRLVVVPDDPRLGEFREEFAGMLALFEERPDEGRDGGPGFAGSRQIVQTDRLFEILEEDPRSRVAARELLEARLVDLLVGDRDRSTNNHLWARFDDGSGGAVWRPIPRDRDQAFVQLDGFLKSLARPYQPRLVYFADEYPSVRGLTRNAWDIDRGFLVALSRQEWLEAVDDVVRSLTDSVIDRAVRALPAEHYAIVGTDLARALRARRDRLPEAAQQLYRIVFEYADVHASDDDEVAALTRRPDGSVHVTVRLAGRDGITTYDRSFTPEETAEIRLYMHGGSDTTSIGGTGPGSILIRVIGGGGRDRFVDTSVAGRHANQLYDGGDRTEVVRGASTRFHPRDAPRPFSWLEDERTLDWGSTWVPEPRLAYDADRGLVTTAGLTLDRHGFLRYPYASRIRIRAGWAFGLSEPVLDYRHYFRDALGALDLRFHARWSGAEVIDFYGFGNETPSGGTVDFHRVPHKRAEVSVLIGFGDGERRQLGVGPVFQYTTTDTTTVSHFLGAAKPYGSGRFAQLGLRASFELDGRDRSGTPSRGYLVEANAAFYPGLADVDRGAFGRARGHVATYTSLPGGNPTLAARVRADKVWGSYPFADAAYLGGASSLRGLHEQRYAGDASLLGSAELRIHLVRMLFIVPTDLGVFGLADLGRVFLEGERSDTWHSSFGGGIWLAPLRRTSTVQASVARASTGRTALYFGIGFAY